ncbi:MAG: DUF3073 domain-containing protein [Dermatophilaceae bacterium]
MGRGRAKAKQTKVARELKYYSPDTDLSALERELHGTGQPRGDADARERDDGEDDDDRWASRRG